MISNEALILLIVSITVSGSIGVVIISVSEDVSNSVQNLGDSVSSNINQNIQIVSDIGSGAVYDDSTDEITLHVQNIGSETIPTSDIILFVDGEIVDIQSANVVNNDRWEPDSVAVITAEKSISGDVRVTVRTSGSKDTVRVRTG